MPPFATTGKRIRAARRRLDGPRRHRGIAPGRARRAKDQAGEAALPDP